MIHNYGAFYQWMRLRPLDKNDIEMLRQWRNDRESNPYLSKVSFITPSMQEKWYEKYRQDQDTMIFAIEDVKDLKKMVGSVSLYNFTQDAAEFGRIMIGDRHLRGKGMGYMATVLCLDIAFTSLELTHVTAFVATDNEPARRAYRKAGFEDAGPKSEAGEIQIRITAERFMLTNPFFTEIKTTGEN